MAMMEVTLHKFQAAITSEQLEPQKFLPVIEAKHSISPQLLIPA